MCLRCWTRYCVGDLLRRLQRVDRQERLRLTCADSYMFTGEHEMYEFDLGNTFNYAKWPT